ncbi:death-associated protein kinase 1-like [Amphiura filiformis]|uniref:death-associated protein kinase 1-like n=1 Tax=Amphiura filiformis TaxID=82378 RepID=UPI003B228741
MASDEETIGYLLEAGAEVFAVNQRFETPLHHFAASASANLYRLLQEGAFINAKDIDHNSPLHAATKAGTFNQAIQLMQAGANLWEANKDGKTILHHVAEKPKEDGDMPVSYNHEGKQISGSMLDIILAIGGVCVNDADKDGNTALHLAAKVKNEDNCIKLMEAGADALLKNVAGYQPLDTFGDRKPTKLAKYLKKQQEERLLQTGKTKLDRVKLFLIGEPEAGKTTLKKTLTSNSSQDTGDLTHCSYKPTPGIDIGHYSIKDAGKKDAGNFSIWDYAGHEEYHVTHSLFLGGDNAIFLVAYDLSRLMDEDHESAEEYYNKLKYWLSFVKAGNHPTKKPVVLLVATHIDTVEQIPGQKLAKEILEELQELFKESLNIGDYSLRVDCRDKKSEEMTALIAALSKLGDDIKGERDVPSLCEVIKKHMTEWCNPEYPVLTVPEFHNRVKVIYSNSGDEVLGNIFEIATEYLHQMGEIYVVKSGELREVKSVVLNPQWLCHTVIGPAFAKERFSFKNKLTDKEKYIMEDFKRLYPNFADYEILLDFLKQLELIFEVDSKRYVMPVKLTRSKKDKLWHEDSTMTVYYGRRIECRDEIDLFSADVFPCFQVAMMKKYSSQSEKPVISLNDLKISQSVEGYVELMPDMRAIQYYVRGRGEGQMEKCHQMLKDIEATIDYELEDRSPGTCVRKKYLSSTEVEKLKDLDKVRGYTKEQLIEAIQGDGVIHEEGTHNTDEVASIVCKGYDMMFVEECGLDCKLEWGMTKQAKQKLEVALDTKRYTRDDYGSLGEACRISESRLEQMETHLQGPSMTSAVLDEWDKGGSHTVGELLHILSMPGLVDNQEAKSILTNMLRNAGQDPSISVTEGDISPGLSLEVLAHRAALRRSSKEVHRSAQPNTLMDHLHHCFPEETAAKLEQKCKGPNMFTGMKDIITELLKLKVSTWWKSLMKGVGVHVQANLQESYRHIVSEHEIFTCLRSPQK